MIIHEDGDFMEFDDFVAHIGTKRHSGRYPWGSGDNPYQRYKTTLQYIDDLRKSGMTPVQIAKSFSTDDYEFTTSDLRKMTAIAKMQVKAEDIARAKKLKETGMSNVAIGTEMGINESVVRSLLSDSANEKQMLIVNTANMLKDEIKDGSFLDISKGSANHLGISNEKLAVAVALLKQEGYETHWYEQPQLGTGKFTNTKVLAPPGTRFPDIKNNPDKIKTIAKFSDDGGRSFLSVEPPISVNPKRVGVRYGSDGGADMDGVIQLRRGVPDISLGNSNYAQVRIKVGDGHYLKGMAMYADDLPDGVDMMFNTNKKDTGNKLDAMKPIKIDKTTGQESELPFGSIVRNKYYADPKTGKMKQGPLNIVGSTKKNDNGEDISYAGEEGGWGKWSKSLSSQMLSKQSPELARRQLEIALQNKQAEFDEINALTNPAVKAKLLRAFADGADSSANHLKAAGLPRTANHVILPINSLKDTEIYAPNYRNGEKVVLIRHPHGGIFEIPELTVNNRNAEANRVLAQRLDGSKRKPLDAVGINSKVAQQLSGADFDGDTVLVIPNSPSGPTKVKVSKRLKDLEGFDPQAAYPRYDGMRTIDGGTYSAKTGKVDYGRNKDGSERTATSSKQTEMGKISNLITDMTIKGASQDEIARAVRHSMVVIDAEKHVLDYKTSAKDNGIPELKKKYQSDPKGGTGAATIISRAKSDVRVPQRKPRPAAEGGPIDPATGERRWVYTGAQYEKNGKIVVKTQKSTRMAEAKDARELSSGTLMEEVYAEHANKLKGLANAARKAELETPSIQRNPTAQKTYAAEVDSLNNKLNIALQNAPRERMAQRVAKTKVQAKIQANPELDKDGRKKLNAAALQDARIRVGAVKQAIKIEPREWEAIQAGAITNNKLNSILDNADLDQVKALAMPRVNTVMVPAKLAQAKSLLSRGYDYSEVAAMLGVPTTTLHDAVN